MSSILIGCTNSKYGFGSFYGINGLNKFGFSEKLLYLCTMTCDTLIKIEPDGRKVWKPKKAYNTQDEAIIDAKQLNSREHRISKVVPYRCTYCKKFHLGRNGKEITDKLRDKLAKDPEVKPKQQLKILGWIDLSLIKDTRKKKHTL